MLNFKNSEGWTKLNQLYVILLVFLCFTTIGQLFSVKNVTVTELFINVFSGEYSKEQFFNYGTYVIAKISLYILIPIGAEIINRMIIFKDILKGKWKIIQHNFFILVVIVLWLVSVMVAYTWQSNFEVMYLNSSSLTVWQDLFKLYELALPALIFGFMSSTFTDYLNARKIKMGTKLSPEIEKEIIEILGHVTLTPKQERHLIRNFRIQANKINEENRSRVAMKQKKKKKKKGLF